MAGGPTVDQIIKKRTADIDTCDATSKTERAKIEGSYTLNLPTLEYIKGVFSFGLSGLKSALLTPIENNERVCKHKALMDADVSFATREGELQVEKAYMSGLAEGRTIALARADKAIEMYKQSLGRLRTRAEVAEAVATECLIQGAPNPPEPQRRTPGLLLATKR